MYDYRVPKNNPWTGPASALFGYGFQAGLCATAAFFWTPIGVGTLAVVAGLSVAECGLMVLLAIRWEDRRAVPPLYAPAGTAEHELLKRSRCVVIVVDDPNAAAFGLVSALGSPYKVDPGGTARAVLARVLRAHLDKQSSSATGKVGE